METETKIIGMSFLKMEGAEGLLAEDAQNSKVYNKMGRCCSGKNRLCFILWLGTGEAKTNY